MLETVKQSKTRIEEQAWFPSRFGPDDQIGALNEIGLEHVVRAAQLVRQIGRAHV